MILLVLLFVFFDVVDDAPPRQSQQEGCGVDDLVEIVLNNKKESGIYDLGTSRPVSFWHVADCVKKKYNGEIKWVEFPQHLKGKYQGYTKALEEWDDYEFMTVEDYLK